MAKTKRAHARAGARTWWRRRNNLNTVWLAVGGLSLVALISFFVLTRGDDTSDGGGSSRAASIYTFKTADIHALAFDPSHSGRLVFGHHGGVMASEDGGRTWADLVDRQNFDGMNLVFDPVNPQALYLAGHNVFSRSDDAGRTWQPIGHDLPGLDLHAFGASAREPGRFYAFATGHGIFFSTQGDASWQPLWTEAPPGTNSIVELDDGALIVGATDRGILRSEDGGKSWSESRSGINSGAIFTVRGVADGRLYAGTSTGLFASNDGGRTWTATALDDSMIISVAVDPDNPDNVMAVDRGGRLYHSTNGGTTWLS